MPENFYCVHYPVVLLLCSKESFLEKSLMYVKSATSFLLFIAFSGEYDFVTFWLMILEAFYIIHVMLYIQLLSNPSTVHEYDIYLLFKSGAQQSNS